MDLAVARAEDADAVARRQRIAEDFGRQYVRFGHSELLGRVVGLLLASAAPLTETEIAQSLGVTKSPVNQITSRLEELQLVRRVRLPGDRRFYYELAPDVFLQAGRNLTRLYEDNVRIADRHLDEALARFAAATAAEREALRPVCERLIQMREFHRRVVDVYAAAMRDWDQARAKLPTVEECVRATRRSARARR
jgi:DNA-binding transcriptional regulator GbsR (MarR family)